ncbi:MAG: hypothetical protein ACM359_20080, partial [Bacillota bacterium]
MVRGILLAMVGLGCAYWVVAWWCVRSFFQGTRRSAGAGRVSTLTPPPAVTDRNVCPAGEREDGDELEYGRGS